jgi:lysozyme
MSSSESLLKYCAIFLLMGVQSSLAAVDNIPNSNIVCATAPQTLPGVDVSVYQAKTNWSTVASSGVSFAFVKATEGRGAKNTAFAQEWPAAQAAGLVRSAYHYFVPTDDPHLQATFFLNTVGELADTDLAPMFDLEITNGMNVSSVLANAQAWLNDVETATGRIPIIYTNASFFNQLGNPAGFDRYPLYVSDYDVNCPKVPLPWKNWTFWQHSGSGTTTGIPGQVDLDMFNGSIDDLGTFITTNVPASAQ